VRDRIVIFLKGHLHVPLAGGVLTGYGRFDQVLTMCGTAITAGGEASIAFPQLPRREPVMVASKASSAPHHTNTVADKDWFWTWRRNCTHLRDVNTVFNEHRS
jgi:hypothetical protein